MFEDLSKGSANFPRVSGDTHECEDVLAVLNVSSDNDGFAQGIFWYATQGIITAVF